MDIELISVNKMFSQLPSNYKYIALDPNWGVYSYIYKPSLNDNGYYKAADSDKPIDLTHLPMFFGEATLYERDSK